MHSYLARSLNRRSPRADFARLGRRSGVCRAQGRKWQGDWQGHSDRQSERVLVSLDLTAVPPGEHAFHIHAFGKCEPPDFKSAGPHFNPDQTRHGYLNPEGSHAGDMPNLHVPADGKLQVEILVPNVSLSGEAPLLDAEGSALVIHAGADDYKSDPAGNSGDRIACGVITP
jgi:superoxide dismutase, Cu-Zn family